MIGFWNLKPSLFSDFWTLLHCLDDQRSLNRWIILKFGLQLRDIHMQEYKEYVLVFGWIHRVATWILRCRSRMCD
ncbi:hypothetical protein L2E82_26893 [Cichorium intybus]|uniref:Uncharacterized protein n=1 Tax=Cichorium intybus TaxID=13427 RepID=A0ACB9CRL3_CICIN|nr:hypothetical protein L2E82_26893 [Cichorium intybus]